MTTEAGGAVAFRLHGHNGPTIWTEGEPSAYMLAHAKSEGLRVELAYSAESVAAERAARESAESALAATRDRFEGFAQVADRLGNHGLAQRVRALLGGNAGGEA